MGTKTDLKSEPGRSPQPVAVDETVVIVKGERYWLFAPVDTDTAFILYLGLYMTRNPVGRKTFFRELAEKYHIEDAKFPVDAAPYLHAGLVDLGILFRYESSESEARSNVSIEK